MSTSLLLLLLNCFSHVRLCVTPIDGSPPGSPIPGVLQARTLKWVAISFSRAKVYGVAKSWTRLNDFTFTFHFSLFTFMHWRRKWQPTPVFLPGESLGWGSLWAAVYGAAQSRTWLKWLSNERKECLKTQNGTRPLIHKMHFGIILAPDDSSRAIKRLTWIL